MRLNSISIIVIVLAIGISAYFLIAINYMHGEPINSPGSEIELPDNNTSDSLFGGIFSYPNFNDKLPYYQYKKFEEVYKRINHERDLANKGGLGSSWSVGSIGVHSIQNPMYNVPDSNRIEIQGRKSLKSMDSLATLILSETDNKQKVLLSKIFDSLFVAFNEFSFEQIGNRNAVKRNNLFYFSINGYSIRDFNTKFYMHNDSDYLAIVKWDDAAHKRGHYERKKITVRYSESSKSLLIPVSENTYNKLQAFYQVFGIVLVVIFIYLFIGLPLDILLNISKGRAFSYANIKSLKIITIASGITSAISLFTPYFLRFIFRNRIPPEISTEPFSKILFNNLPIIVFTFAAFFITKAFIRGNKLQEEQALTI